MFDTKKLLADYRKDHRNFVNETLHFIGIPMIVASLLLFALKSWQLGLGLFVAGWILQIIGHLVFEKNRPAFLKNIVHLLIGPIWWIATCLSLFRKKTQ